MVRCTDCGMVYLQNAPKQEMLKSDFAWEKTLNHERARRRENRKVYYFFSDGIKKIKKALRRGPRKEIKLMDRLPSNASGNGKTSDTTSGKVGGKIVDIGCADGGTLSGLDMSRWTPFGIEPSPGFAKVADELCKKHGGYVVQQTAIEALPTFEPGFFDAIMMRSYLEHEAHASDVLEVARKALKDGGFVMIKVPNAACINAKLRGNGWPGVRHPDHVNYFSPKHLQRCVKQAGFSRVYFPWTRRSPASDNMWLIGYA